MMTVGVQIYSYVLSSPSCGHEGSAYRVMSPRMFQSCTNAPLLIRIFQNRSRRVFCASSMGDIMLLFPRRLFFCFFFSVLRKSLSGIQPFLYVCMLLRMCALSHAFRISRYSPCPDVFFHELFFSSLAE